MRGIVRQERQGKRDENEKSRGIRKWSKEGRERIDDRGMRGIVGQERQGKRDEKEKSRGIRKWSKEGRERKVKRDKKVK